MKITEKEPEICIFKEVPKSKYKGVRKIIILTPFIIA